MKEFKIILDKFADAETRESELTTKLHSIELEACKRECQKRGIEMRNEETGIRLIKRM